MIRLFLFLTISAYSVEFSLSCRTPSPLNNGHWYCYSSICSLECDSGYVAINKSVNTFNNGSWTTNPEDMSCQVGIALLTGGLGAYQSVETFAEDGSSALLPDLPDKRYIHSVDYVDGHPILCGGGDTTNSCLEMAPNDEWIPHSTTLRGRKDFSSVVNAGRLTLIGGSFAPTSTEFLVPGQSSTWKKGLPLLEPTGGACAVPLPGDSFLVTGGFNGDNHRHTVLYSTTDGTARRLQDMIRGRWYHGCSRIMNSTFSGVLVAGGYDIMHGTTSTELYNIDAGKWKQAGDLRTGRDGLQLVVLGADILAMGGRNQYDEVISTVEKFSLNTLTWDYSGDLKIARAYFALTVIPQKYIN